jgi:fumarylacetoacetase
MPHLDHTHDKATTSWEATANGHPQFPIQNLPLCVFSRAGEAARAGVARAGVAIGDKLLDLAAAGFEVSVPLNDFLAGGPAPRRALRWAVFDLLKHGAAPRPDLLLAQNEAVLHLPFRVGDVVDYYAGIYHALTTGRMLRPDQPLTPNYQHLPIAFTCRSSTVRPSGTPVHRPNGQRKPGRETVPSFGPSRNLDFELEVGIWLGAGSELGHSVPIGEAAEHIAGYCLFNDWSARDIQGWETVPLGPFMGKSFLTTISPYVVTPEALAPFRTPAFARLADDPAVLDYLLDAADQAEGGLDLVLEAWISTPTLAEPHLLARSSAEGLYWTPAQLVAHQSSNGCDLNAGDLLASGTLSGPTPESAGSILELTKGGRAPIQLPNGETRRFLEDGDSIELRGYARRDGFAQIGFGPCVGTIDA